MIQSLITRAAPLLLGHLNQFLPLLTVFINNLSTQPIQKTLPSKNLIEVKRRD
jgi:hypothetical protein